MMLYVDVRKIQPNPWQTRERIDEAYVQELAADIKSRRDSRPDTKGLLQMPAGRPVDSSGKPAHRDGRTDKELGTAVGEGTLLVQLTYGHNRLAAFRFLADTDPFYSHMPVDLIIELTNQEMATAAWAENYARRDLTPIEQARAIDLMMKDFEWTQQQVAICLNLERSTVAHKLRLLKLPEEVQAKVQSGEVSERQAMAILPLTALPKEALATLPAWQKERAEKLVTEAGTTDSVSLRKQVEYYVAEVSRDLTEARFWLGWVYEGEGTHTPACEGCDLRHGDACQGPGCYQARTEEWDRRWLAEISAEVGVPAWDPAERRKAQYGEWSRFNEHCDQQIPAFAQEQSCLNLRIVRRNDNYGLQVEGHPDAMWACTHGPRKHCRCRSQMSKEQEKQQAQAKRDRTKAVQVIKRDLIARLQASVDAGETGALRAIAYHLAQWDKKKETMKMERPALVGAIAKIVAEQANVWEQGSAEEKQKWATEWFKVMGLNGDGNNDHRGAAMTGAEGLEEFRRRFDRIQGWMAQPLIERLASDGAIRGNIDNLERLMAELGELPQDDNVESLALQMARAQRELEELLGPKPAESL